MTNWIDGFADHVPSFLYGTAWKEAETQRLTELAIDTGFRGIDTANQRRHYDEASVGRAIYSVLSTGGLARSEIFVQTKFTFKAGQDHRLPYDPAATIAAQIRQSFSSSQEHLQLAKIDSYVLHGPSRRFGLGPDDWEAWRAMEDLVDVGLVRYLGISNVGLDQLKSLYRSARVKPRFVQNRCFARQGWDQAIRAVCRQQGMIYQAFSLLTANLAVLADRDILQIAEAYNCGPCQVVIRFALDVGVLPLTGTTNRDHMIDDLRVCNFTLSDDDIRRIEHVAMPASN